MGEGSEAPGRAGGNFGEAHEKQQEIADETGGASFLLLTLNGPFRPSFSLCSHTSLIM